MADARDRLALQEISARVQQGDFAGARTICENFLRSIREISRQAPVRTWLGLIEHRSGSLPAALTQYELARQADRRNPQLTLQLGITHFELGQWDKAEPLYREAIRMEPRLPLAHYNLGVLLQQKRDFPAARRAFEAALVHQPRFPEALNNLANTLTELRDLPGAEACYRQAIAFHPSFSYAHHGLGLLLVKQNRHTEGLSSLRATVHHNPDFLDGWLDLAECQALSGDLDAAKLSVEAVIERDPQHAAARFRRAAYAGEQPESMPTQFVERLYAGMAATFDEHLVERLGYQIPSELASALKPWLDQFTALHQQKPRVVDLGCGTGLFGVQIRAAAAHLVGVDLSQAMLDKARARGVYDDLVVSDLGAFLHSNTDIIDLISATDVLIYIGNLSPLFTAAAARLAVGGMFAFSIEAPDDLNEGLRLQAIGRYAHSVQYIEKQATANGFRISARDATVIRTESSLPVKGFLFLLEKAETSAA